MKIEKFRSYRYKVWVKQAEFDLLAARLSLQNGYYEWACFQAEQAAEKALKGTLVFCGYKPPKVHKLSILYHLARKTCFSKIHEVSIESLQAYTFVSRYPFIIPGDNLTPHDFMTHENAVECIHEAERVLDLVKEIIDKQPEYERS